MRAVVAVGAAGVAVDRGDDGEGVVLAALGHEEAGGVVEAYLFARVDHNACKRGWCRQGNAQQSINGTNPKTGSDGMIGLQSTAKVNPQHPQYETHWKRRSEAFAHRRRQRLTRVEGCVGELRHLRHADVKGKPASRNQGA